jgi:hypothetical protein
MKINNMTDLTNEMAQAIDAIKNGDKTLDEGNTLANLAGKIINGMRVQIDYARARKETPEIAFMKATAKK